MKRILQPDLMRGHKAERAAVALFLGLLTVLFVSMMNGLLSLHG